MRISPTLAKRVRKELKRKYLTTEGSGGAPEAEGYCKRRFKEMRQMLADSITIAGDFVITPEDIASLSTDLAVMQVSDPEGYAEVRAILDDSLDLESCEGDFVENFEKAFTEYWSTQGLRDVTIKLILAERQAATIT